MTAVLLSRVLCAGAICLTGCTARPPQKMYVSLLKRVHFMIEMVFEAGTVSRVGVSLDVIYAIVKVWLWSCVNEYFTESSMRGSRRSHNHKICKYFIAIYC